MRVVLCVLHFIIYLLLLLCGAAVHSASIRGPLGPSVQSSVVQVEEKRSSIGRLSRPEDVVEKEKSNNYNVDNSANKNEDKFKRSRSPRSSNLGYLNNAELKTYFGSRSESRSKSNSTNNSKKPSLLDIPYHGSTAKLIAHQSNGEVRNRSRSRSRDKSRYMNKSGRGVENSEHGRDISSMRRGRSATLPAWMQKEVEYNQGGQSLNGSRSRSRSREKNNPEDYNFISLEKVMNYIGENDNLGFRSDDSEVRGREQSRSRSASMSKYYPSKSLTESVKSGLDAIPYHGSTAKLIAQSTRSKGPSRTRSRSRDRKSSNDKSRSISRVGGWNDNYDERGRRSNDNNNYNNGGRRSGSRSRSNDNNKSRSPSMSKLGGGKVAAVMDSIPYQDSRDKISPNSSSSNANNIIRKRGRDEEADEEEERKRMIIRRKPNEINTDYKVAMKYFESNSTKKESDIPPAPALFFGHEKVPKPAKPSPPPTADKKLTLNGIFIY